MTRPLRPVLALCLAALVALTGLHVGMARGQAGAAGIIVICSGSGPVSIAVDAQGQPTGHVQTCPDCVMSVIAGLAEPVELAAPVLRPVALGWRPAPRPVVGPLFPSGRARDPPRLS